MHDAKMLTKSLEAMAVKPVAPSVLRRLGAPKILTKCLIVSEISLAYFLLSLEIHKKLVTTQTHMRKSLPLKVII